MKFKIRQAQMTFVDRTFTDPTKLELSWQHDQQGCMIVVDKSIGWKKLCYHAREMKHAFKKHLGAN